MQDHDDGSLRPDAIENATADLRRAGPGPATQPTTDAPARVSQETRTGAARAKSATEAKSPAAETDSSPSSVRSSAASSSAHSSTSHSIEISTETFFQNMAASRYRSSLWIIFGMMVFAFFTVPVNRDPQMRWVGGSGLLWISTGLAAMRWMTRPGKAINRRAYDVIVLLTLAGLIPLIYFFGTYMPFAGLIGLLLLSYFMSADPRLSLFATLMVGGAHTLIHALITFGAIRDRGMLVVDGELDARLMNLASIVSIYGFSWVLGYIFRSRSRQTLSDLEEAVRQVSAREALLREARLDLERAAGIGQAGRFTDQHLGSYVLGPILGRGGMGEIYEAEHVETGAPAAVKLLRRRADDTDNLLQRFIREADLVAGVDSPHVVRVLEVGGLDAVLPYIAMERLVGTDLAQLLRREHRLPLPEVLAMTHQVAAGLHAAHEQGIVHRDIKPQNLFHCTDGTWKVLDFGVARLAGDSHTLTGTNLIGTPSYMAPEQLSESGSVTAQTDVHALSVVFYRTITGRPAFAGKDVTAVLDRVVRTLPVAPSSLESVPVELDDVLRIGLAKHPEGRFETVLELAQALAEAGRGKSSREIRQRASRLNEQITWRPG